MTQRPLLSFAIALVIGSAGAAFGQAGAEALDAGPTTTLTAMVHEQCQVTVPAAVTFDVTRPAERTTANPASVAVENVVLPATARQLRLSVRANAASFRPPVAGAATWSAGDVSWTAAMWTHGEGEAGTLSDAAYRTVATAGAGSPSMATHSLAFTLAPHSAAPCAGGHTLTITWKVESIGS